MRDADHGFRRPANRVAARPDLRGDSRNRPREKTAASTAPLYLLDGSPIPNGVDPERVTFIVRSFVAPPVREDEPAVSAREEIAPAVERQEQPTPLDYPQWGVV
jgi:hypothetical protein